MKDAVPELPACSSSPAILRRIMETHGPCANPVQNDVVGMWTWLLPDGCFVRLRRGEIHFDTMRQFMDVDGSCQTCSGDEDCSLCVDKTFLAFQMQSGAMRVVLTHDVGYTPSWFEIDADVACKPTREQVRALDRVVQHALMEGRQVHLNTHDLRTHEDESVEHIHSIHASRFFKEE